jgi:23S rRNA pseudouridine1911/1915/1917 synthase
MIKNQFQVIFEDNHLLAVNKPSGMLSQGDRTKDAPISELAKQYIKEKYKKPGEGYLGVPHSIDRPTRGL